MHEDTLAHVDLFAGLDKKDLQLLAALARNASIAQAQH